MPPSPPLGIVEGYFGPSWDWTDRTHLMRALAPHGFRRFLYAPKADAFLRERWRDAHPRDETASLAAFALSCRRAGVRFGIGLSPFELHLAWDQAGRDALARKMDGLAGLAPDEIAVLFDDMKGDVADLAAIQADIAHFAAGLTDAKISLCPSYYSDDPVLDRVFGARPHGYLEDLGRRLDPSIEIFWTGPEVVSREFTPAHLAGVTRRLGRKPVLWDNYPVNDGPRMSRFLHLRGFTGRGGIGAGVAAHLINPALQPHLSIVPALTLAALYRGADYDYLAATHAALREAMPAPLAEALADDLLLLNDAGRERIDADALGAKYTRFDHPAAREVVRFLKGGYAVTGEEVQTG